MRHPPGVSPSDRELDPLWAVAQEAGVPILFHVGGEEKMHKDYLENGLPFVKDFQASAWEPIFELEKQWKKKQGYA